MLKFQCSLKKSSTWQQIKNSGTILLYLWHYTGREHTATTILHHYFLYINNTDKTSVSSNIQNHRNYEFIAHKQLHICIHGNKLLLLSILPHSITVIFRRSFLGLKDATFQIVFLLHDNIFQFPKVCVGVIQIHIYQYGEHLLENNYYWK